MSRRTADRLIFTSLNAAACTAAAAAAPVVIVGALTNASATARTITAMLESGVAERCTIVPCGERWTSVSDEPDSLRPSIEDLLGAGAIVAALRTQKASPEAALAAASYQSVQGEIRDVLRRCISGRALIDRGFPADVELASTVDSSGAVPVWRTSDPVRVFSDINSPHVPLAGASPGRADGGREHRSSSTERHSPTGAGIGASQVP